MKSKRITVTLYGDVVPWKALQMISDWYAENAQNSDKFPMTGIVTNRVYGLAVCRRYYRKGDCFAVEFLNDGSGMQPKEVME